MVCRRRRTRRRMPTLDEINAAAPTHNDLAGKVRAGAVDLAS